MTPYLQAHAAYHSAGPPECPWLTLLDCLLQNGIVYSTPSAFLLAKACRASDPPADQTNIFPLQFHPDPDCWHVFLAAGDLGALRNLPAPVPLPWVSYYRRDGRLRIRPYSSIARHDQAQKHPIARPGSGPSAGERLRPGNRAGPA